MTNGPLALDSGARGRRGASFAELTAYYVAVDWRLRWVTPRKAQAPVRSAAAAMATLGAKVC